MSANHKTGTNSNALAIKRMASFITAVVILLAFNPFMVNSAVYSVDRPIVNVSTNQVTFSSWVRVDSTYTYTLGFVYSSQTTWPEVGYGTEVYSFSQNITTNSALNFSGTVTYLPNSTYYVRAFAVGSNGAYVYSEPASFSTGSYGMTVTTGSAGYGEGRLQATGYVSSGDTVTDKGFVYSTSSSTPSLNDSSSRYGSSGSGDGSFTGSFSVSTGSSYYYVRAYATTRYGTSYGQTITVEGYSSNKPSVSLSSVTSVTGYSADVEINVTNSGSSSVSSRGVVYSSSGIPSRNDSSNVSISGTTGPGSASLTNLSPNTTYYVRAYATNSYGTSYSEAQTLATSAENTIVQTNAVTNIQGTSATANGYIANSNRYTITERGFVYSSVSDTPTTSHSRIYDTVSTTASGNFNRDLTGLNTGTRYYVRAYVKTSGGSVYYGKTVSFTTSGAATATETGTVTISYQNLSGLTVGTQTINGKDNQLLDRQNLLIPFGYTLHNPTWQHRVTGTGPITVLVVPIGVMEANFMPVGPGSVFRPEDFALRHEAAQVLYNLSDKQMGGAAASFNDVANDYKKPAIDYVASRNIMIGYPEGGFRPDAYITRAEMAVILCNFYNLTGQAASGFSDVSTDNWAYNYVSLAAQAGIIHGYPDGTYRPNNNITRAETCVLFSQAEKRSLNPISLVDFKDVSPSHWAYKYIMNAASPTP